MEEDVWIRGNPQEGFELTCINGASQALVERTLAATAAKGRVRSLDLEGAGPIDLAPLPCLHELEHLVIGDAVQDLAPLAELQKLAVLDLSYGKRQLDLRPLRSMSGLRELDLAHSAMDDIEVLAGIEQLETLDLSGVLVPSLLPLSRLRALKELRYCTTTADLRPLSCLIQIGKLSVYGNQDLQDLTPIRAMSGLRDLDLRNTAVHDLGPLAALPDLKKLAIDGTRVEDLTPLVTLQALTTLLMRHLQVIDLGPLARLGNLEMLSVWDVPVTDATPLHGLSQLRHLDLALTRVTDITALAGLRQLECLVLWRTPVHDLRPLRSLRHLRVVCVQDTGVDKAEVRRLQRALRAHGDGPRVVGTSSFERLLERLGRAMAGSGRTPPPLR